MWWPNSKCPKCEKGWGSLEEVNSKWKPPRHWVCSSCGFRWATIWYSDINILKKVNKQ